MKKTILISLLCLPFVLLSQIPEHSKGTYVDDFAGVISTSEKATINQAIRKIEDSFGVQIAIVLVDHLPDNYSIEDYAREIGRKWRVGIDRKGLVYVAAIQDHKQRLEVSNHLEGVIPDITAKQITDEMKTYFRAQRYGEGITELITDVNIELTKNKVEVKPPANNPRKHALLYILLGIWALGVVGFILVVRRVRRKRLKKLQEEMENREEYERKQTKMVLDTIRRRTGSFETNNQVSQNTGRTNVYTDEPAVIIPVPIQQEEYTPSAKPYESSGSSYSSNSGSSSNNDSGSSSSYGDYGSSSSDSSYSSSSDSGYSGGGSSNDW